MVAELAGEHTVRKTKTHRLFHSLCNKSHRSQNRLPFITSSGQTHPRWSFYVALHMISPTHAVTCRVELYDSVLIFQSAICLIILLLAAQTRPFMTEKPNQTANKEPANSSQLPGPTVFRASDVISARLLRCSRHSYKRVFPSPITLPLTELW